jgi:hypothetical protein
VATGAPYVDADDDAVADVHRAMAIASDTLIPHIAECAHGTLGQESKWGREGLRTKPNVS